MNGYVNSGVGFCSGFFPLLRRFAGSIGFDGLLDFGNGFDGFNHFPFHCRRRGRGRGGGRLDVFNHGDKGPVGGNPEFAPDGGVGGIVKGPFAVRRELDQPAAVVDALHQGGEGDVALGFFGLCGGLRAPGGRVGVHGIGQRGNFAGGDTGQNVGAVADVPSECSGGEILFRMAVPTCSSVS